MSSNPFDFDFGSGALCLDFANTVDWHASAHPTDRLQSFSHLAAWAEAAGLLSPDASQEFTLAAESQPLLAAWTFHNTLRLREAIYRIFTAIAAGSSVAAGSPVDPADLALLNQYLSDALPHLKLVQSPAGFAWTWEPDETDLDLVAWAVARSASELLTSERLPRTRQCADDRGCGYLFIDLSRNGSRRWCSMASCGNRAKARRHYQNQ